MDSLIAAAARALETGDALGALKRIALRDDPPALALRGVAMAQLGDYPRARKLLKRAARAFGAHEPLARARCVVAEAEVALATRDLTAAPRALTAAAVALEARGDRPNAMHARLIGVRRLLLLGRIDEAAAALTALDARDLPPPLLAIAELAAGELALRSLRTTRARAALARAAAAAERAGIPALLAEVAGARAQLDRPAARRARAGRDEPLRLEDVETLQDSGVLVVDACRRMLCAGGAQVSLARRPILFALALVLAEAWPHDADRRALIERAFRIRRPDDSHRARLRVELGRLRKLVSPFAHIDATEGGFKLAPQPHRDVVALKPPIDGEQASLLALLADGAAWSTSALALALGTSQRTVQRALAESEAAGRVRSIGRARSKRWLSAPLAGFTTILLLPASLPGG
jgi:hypothetical protein